MARSIIDVNYRREVALQSTNLSERDILNACGAYQLWLSKEWLNEDGGNHPGQILWRTGGWAADSEMYMIGSAIRELHRNRDDMANKRRKYEQMPTGALQELQKRMEYSVQAGNPRGWTMSLKELEDHSRFITDILRRRDC